MNQRDQIKVINAGFTILRSEPQSLKIKFKDKENLNWRTLLGAFESKAALQRRMNELLQFSFTIED